MTESGALGDTAFRMDDVDDTLCEQLSNVRDAEGFDQVATLEIAQWGEGSRSSVDGPRENAVAYLDDLGAGSVAAQIKAAERGEREAGIRA